MKSITINTSIGNKKTTQKIFLLLIFCFASANGQISGGNLKYCTGTVKQIIARDATTATHVMLETDNGTTGYAQIGDGTGYNEFENVQISLLLSAYMAGKKVRLELNKDGFGFRSCESFQNGIPVRYVMLDAAL